MSTKNCSISTPCLQFFLLIHVGFEYLKFINIFADDGVTLELVEATSRYRAFTPIYVDGGIPIGTRIETTAYVSEPRVHYYIIHSGTDVDQWKWRNIIWRWVAILVPISFPNSILLLAKRHLWCYCSILEQCWSAEGRKGCIQSIFSRRQWKIQRTSWLCE